ncbi:MAG: leucine-rich repeat domain-containing protein [Lachnospiraceae bacterium]|nr:leucine-rich repeat domain-containing protein [Lachnospiraceae bacterium]
MKKIRINRHVKIILTLLLFTALAGVVSVSSSKAATKGDYKYEKVKGGVEIRSYIGKDKNVKIPDKIAGKNVVRIDDSAFDSNKKVRKVTIPDTVETIGVEAFHKCSNLKQVKLSKKLTKIEAYAFDQTGLTSVNIPDSVKEIKQGAFYSCKKLKKVKLGTGMKLISIGCFEECTSLSSINLEDIEEIGAQAFKGDKSLAGILNLNSVTMVETEAFYGCEGITEVNFTDNLQLLGKKSANPFAYCKNIERFNIPKENGNYTCLDGVIYGKADESLVAWPARKAEAVVLKNNIKKIYAYAFSGAGITSMSMEGEVNYIGKEAFSESMISQVFLPLPDGTKNIFWSYDAFRNCSALVKAVFPDKTVSSNSICFYYCTALKEVVLPDTMASLSDEMFLGCTALESINIPKNVSKIPVACFYKCSSLKNVNMENINEIGAAAFAHCSGLSGTITLNAQKLGVLSFLKCTNIKEVKFNKPLGKILFQDVLFHEDIPELTDCQVIYISYGKLQSNPFAGCTALTSISVPEGGEVRSIDGVLYSADMRELIAFPAALTGKFNVPYGVAIICSFAFEDSAVTEIVTANSVNSIYYNAFDGSSVKSITLAKGVSYLEEFALDGCSQLETINVHASNKKFESVDGVLYYKKAKGSLLLYPPARKGAKYTVRKDSKMESDAFSGCKYLKKVVVPEGVKSGDGLPFYNCKKIKLYLPKSMKTYSANYYDDDDLTSLSYVFDKTCKGCKLMVKKNSPLAKYFDKKKVKYYKY